MYITMEVLEQFSILSIVKAKMFCADLKGLAKFGSDYRATHSIDAYGNVLLH